MHNIHIKFLLALFLVFYSSLSLANCDLDETKNDIVYLTTDEYKKHSLSEREAFQVARSLKNLYACNDTKFEGVEIYAPIFSTEWVFVTCEKWVRRPNGKGRKLKRYSCMKHFEYYPEIKVKRQQYYLETFFLKIHFQDSEFVKAVLDPKNA